MASPIVLDLSHHNVIPESLVPAKSAGIVGVIHKATEGSSYKDDKVDARQALAGEAGLLFGLYHFIRHGNVQGQVDNFLSVYRRYSPANLLVALDYEDAAVSLDECEEWLQKVANATGKTPVLYSGHVLKEKLGSKVHKTINQNNYPLWLAQYSSSPTLPKGWTSYWIWQYTDQGTIDGVTPPTDLNVGEVNEVIGFWQDERGPVPNPVPLTITITVPAGTVVKVVET